MSIAVPGRQQCGRDQWRFYAGVRKAKNASFMESEVGADDSVPRETAEQSGSGGMKDMEE